VRPLHAAAALLVMVLWGVNFPIGKIGLQEMPPLTFMALRFGLVAVLLAPFVRPPTARMKEILLLSFTLGFLHFALMFTGLKHADSAVAAVTVQIQVPFATALGVLFFRESLGWRRMAGMALAMAGVAFLAGEPGPGSELWAVGLIIAAAAVWAFSNIQMKRLSDVNSFALNGWMALFAVPQLALGSAVLETGQIEAIRTAGWEVWAAIVYQAVVVVILCYGIWYFLLNRYRVNQTMPWTLLVPVFGVLAGVVMLGEPLTLRLVLGGLATIAGVAIIMLRRPDTVAAEIRNA